MTDAPPDRPAILPDVPHLVTARDIVMGAAASRDWQPQHHNHQVALRMNLPGVIMNAPTQTGWLHGYAKRWAGPGARIAAWRLKMRAPVCSGDQILFTGRVLKVSAASGQSAWMWVWLDLGIDKGETVLSTMRLVLARPTQPGFRCLDIPDDEWVPPGLDPSGLDVA